MHRMKIAGKPYEGKLHVRFDEGALKVERTTHADRQSKSVFYSIFLRRPVDRGPIQPNGRSLEGILADGESDLVNGSSMLRDYLEVKISFCLRHGVLYKKAA